MYFQVQKEKVEILAITLLLFTSVAISLFMILPTVDGDPPFSGNRKVNTGSDTANQLNAAIIVDPSGIVYVAWEDERNDNGDIYFANSTDGGATWSNPNMKINTDNGTEIQGTPSLALDSTGTIYAAWSDNRNGYLNIYFANSKDGGATWTDPNVRVKSSTAFQSDPTMAVDSTGTIYLAWQNGYDGDWDIYFVKSNDGGTTWTDPPTRVNTDSTSFFQLNPTIAVNSSGAIYMAWDDERNGNSDIYFTKSTDGGATWTDPNLKVNTDSTSYSQYNPTIAVDLMGTVYLAWQDHRNGNPDIYFAKSTDGGENWTHPNVKINTDMDATSQREPSLVVSPTGIIYIAWEDFRWDEFDIYFGKSTDGGATWTDPNLRVNDDATDKAQRAPNLAVDTIGTVYLAWEDRRFGDNYDIYSAKLEPEHPISPRATNLRIDGFAPMTQEIQHIISSNPVFSFSYLDLNSDHLAGYNVSVWDANDTSLLWYCNLSDSLPSGSEVIISYNSTPCPTNGPPLEDGTTYKLRVSVVNSSGSWSAVSEVNFHMNVVLIPITPVSPLDDSLILTSSFQTVSWTSPGNDTEGDSPVSFYWEVATDPAFTNIVESDSGLVNESGVFNTSLPGNFFWRVNMTDGWETSSFCNPPDGYWNFTTYISSIENNPPTITNKASVPNIAIVNSSMTFTFAATDEDSDSLSWSKISGSDWLNIGSSNGTLYGIPSSEDIGSNEFIIQVSDGKGGSDSHTFSINVQLDSNGNGGPKDGDSDDSGILWFILAIIIVIVVIVLLFLLKHKKK
jgi:hypothetical protein